MRPTWRLGLIGGNITASRSPALHIAAALSVGGNASYDLLIPAEHGLTFPQMLTWCQAQSYDGVNVTYPYKEEATRLIASSPDAAAIGAANTLTLTPQLLAHNTDSSGFVAAFRARWPDAAPGHALIFGAGGAGRAVAFALLRLNAASLTLVDTDAPRAASLAAALRAAASIPIHTTAPSDLTPYDGLINCTPLGMTGRPGCPLPPLPARPRWAFDAVYTPEATEFTKRCNAMGADLLSGYDLYFHQGIQAFHLFTGQHPDVPWLRQTLAKGRGT